MELSELITAFAPLGKILAILALFVFAGVLLDYLTGSIAARINHEWTSSKAREGIWHKVGIFICIIVAALLDVLIIIAAKASVIKLPLSYSGFFAPLIEIMFILTEFCSILENLGKMGVPIPEFLVKGIAAFRRKADEQAAELIEEDPSEGEGSSGESDDDDEPPDDTTIPA